METGWLIERRENNATEWWGLADALGSWTNDSAKALRFARSEDAEAYAHSTGLDDAGFTTYITDHEWLDAPALAPKSNLEAFMEKVGRKHPHLREREDD